MIVDDERISLMMTTHILSSAYSTVSASSGKEALELYAREKPDMILSDLRMPEMTGYELQQNMVKEFGDHVPFMFMTADTDEESESRGFENGAMDFIRKPFRADVLLNRVANILRTVEKIQGLKKAAVMDPMTGLLNKASAEAEIERMCSSSQGVLMMIDLDSFKLVNDIYGHAMGDKILIRFAEILSAVVRPMDIVGRLGGDEFVAFCQNVSEEVVIEKKSRFINKHILEAAKEFMGEDMTIPIGASLGCVFVNKEDRNFNLLHKKADKALYNVKKNGKHGFEFYRDGSSDDAHSSNLPSGLEHAVKVLAERNEGRGAFVLGYENFRTAYRFLVRLNANYQKEISILLFTVKEKTAGENLAEEGIDAFIELLASSLRQSDIVSKNAKNQCLVVLPETPSSNVKVVIDRIMDKWSKEELAGNYTVGWEEGRL